MAKIKKVIENGGIQYPATITDAVKNPNNGKTVTEELSELGSELSSVNTTSFVDSKANCAIKELYIEDTEEAVWKLLYLDRAWADPNTSSVNWSIILRRNEENLFVFLKTGSFDEKEVFASYEHNTYKIKVIVDWSKLESGKRYNGGIILPAAFDIRYSPSIKNIIQDEKMSSINTELSSINTELSSINTELSSINTTSFVDSKANCAIKELYIEDTEEAVWKLLYLDRAWADPNTSSVNWSIILRRNEENLFVFLKTGSFDEKEVFASYEHNTYKIKVIVDWSKLESGKRYNGGIILPAAFDIRYSPSIKNIIKDEKIETKYTGNIIRDHLSIKNGGVLLSFGDSITYGYTSTSSDDKANEGNYKYIEIVASKLGLKLSNYAASGATLTDCKSLGKVYTYDKIIEAKENSINPELIILAIGINDYRINNSNLGVFGDADGTFYGEYRKAVKLLKELWVDVPIILITPIRYLLNEQVGQISLDSFRKAVFETGVSEECSVIDGSSIPFPFESGLLSAKLLADKLHPTSLGYKLMGDFISGILLPSNVSLIRNSYLKSMNEWSRLGMGMFIHWGVYSVLGGKYSGLNIDGETVDINETVIPEWIYKKGKLPKDVYKGYSKDFNSENFDAESIVRMAYNAGFKYIVITAKHHDGFLLYNNPNAEWNISSSSADNDVLLKLKEACDKYNIKFCIYYSERADWTSTGGFGQDYITGADPYTLDEHIVYCSKTIDILKDLISTLQPYVLWYDGVKTFNSPYKEVCGELFYKAFETFYPQIIVNDRLFADERADYFCGENSYYKGEYKYAEDCLTTNFAWGYSIDRDNAENTISLSKLLNTYILESIGRSHNVLVNIGPKGDGSLPQYCVELFRELGDFQRKNGLIREYGDRLYVDCQPNWGRCFVKNNILKCYAQFGKDSIKLDGVLNTYLSKAISYDGDNLSIVKVDEETTIISGISKRENDIPTVVDLVFDSDIICNDYNIIDENNLIISSASYNIQTNGIYQVNNYTGSIGGLTSDSIFTTKFKFKGNSGNYRVILNINGRGAGDKHFNIKTRFNDGLSEQMVDCSDTLMISSNTVNLVENKVYYITTEKTGDDWCNFSSLELEKVS